MTNGVRRARQRREPTMMVWNQGRAVVTLINSNDQRMKPAGVYEISPSAARSPNSSGGGDERSVVEASRGIESTTVDIVVSVVSGEVVAESTATLAEVEAVSVAGVSSRGDPVLDEAATLSTSLGTSLFPGAGGDDFHQRLRRCPPTIKGPMSTFFDIRTLFVVDEGDNRIIPFRDDVCASTSTLSYFHRVNAYELLYRG